MYQKKGSMYENKGKVGRIFLALLMVLFLPNVLLAGGEAQTSEQPDVDSIYNTIRKSLPEYEVQEQILTFQNEGKKLVATLVLPKGLEKPPIVCTFNGFGEDRFYKVIPNTGGENFYPRLSRLFAERGIATLRVDYRGSGDSDGNYTMTTFSSQASDALAAIEFVSTTLNNKVNTSKIGMFGFSQGGLVTSLASGKDERIKSAVIWSGVTSPPFTYGSLLSFDGIRKGANLPEGKTIKLPITLGELSLGDIELGEDFFDDLFTVDPRAAIRDYKGPLMYVAGKKDPVVFPQPQAGQSLLDNHDGIEKLVLLPGDHEFDSDYDYPVFDDAVFWAIAWYKKTL